GVVAAGRRWRALKLLLKRKKITLDYKVPCLITTPERATAISLAENSGRVELHPADEYEAFRRLVSGGMSVEDVAAKYRVAPVVVKQRLKLANVCPDFIALYRSGEIGYEHMMAFAITDDQEQQKAIWNALPKHGRTAYAIRRALTESE